MGSILSHLGSLRRVIKVDLTGGFLLKDKLEQRCVAKVTASPRDQCSQAPLTGGTDDSEFFLDVDPELPACAHASRYNVLQGAC